MLIIPIALLAGFSVAIIVYIATDYVAKLNLEKRLKATIETNADKLKKSNARESILFIASKIGDLAKRRNYPYFVRHAEKIRKDTTILGDPFDRITPFTFIGLQFLAGFSVIIVAVVVLDVYNIVLLAGFGVLGFVVPPALLQTKVKEKHKAIFRQIPEVLDLLSLMIEAGLDFNTAINKIIDSEDGQLVKELRLQQQEVKLGKSRVDALSDMAEKIGYTPLTTMVNSLTVSLKTGGSIAPVLKTLAEQFRVERSQLAEKMAGEAPLKLMLPLVLLIFPTIFIILFGPIILTFIGGSGF